MKLIPFKYLKVLLSPVNHLLPVSPSNQTPQWTAASAVNLWKKGRSLLWPISDEQELNCDKSRTPNDFAQRCVQAQRWRRRCECGQEVDGFMEKSDRKTFAKFVGFFFLSVVTFRCFNLIAVCLG